MIFSFSIKSYRCASYMEMLCRHALEAYGQFNVSAFSKEGNLKQRGLLINYESLPGAIPRIVLPMFDVQPSKSWIMTMKRESQQYSKGRGGRVGVFAGDSQDKDKRSTPAIREYSDLILGSSYQQMNDKARLSLTVSPDSHHFRNANWTTLREIL